VRLGVVAEGAPAHLLPIDRIRVEDIPPVVHPGKAFLVIMKDGTIYKACAADVRPWGIDPGDPDGRGAKYDGTARESEEMS
jgi:hypothetical protein